MADRPRLLDLFSGAGGCAAGYVRAGFDVTGVDHVPQPRYLLSGATAFVQADALEYLREHGREYDVIHASPPCQGYSKCMYTPGSRDKDYPILLGQTRQELQDTRKPFVIENVEFAPMHRPIVLCGSMFGLRVRRHRLFESNYLLMAPGGKCQHTGEDVGVYAMRVTALGSHGTPYVASSGRTHYRPVNLPFDEGAEAMGVDWMTRAELCQAIPPAYAEFVGRQMLAYVRGG